MKKCVSVWHVDMNMAYWKCWMFLNYLLKALGQSFWMSLISLWTLVLFAGDAQSLSFSYLKFCVFIIYLIFPTNKSKTRKTGCMLFEYWCISDRTVHVCMLCVCICARLEKDGRVRAVSEHISESCVNPICQRCSFFPAKCLCGFKCKIIPQTVQGCTG